MAKKKTKVFAPKKQKSYIFATVSELKLAADNYNEKYRNVEEYLRMEYNTKQLKKEGITWLEGQDKKLASRAKKLEDWRFMIFGKLCFILNNGGELSENSMSFLNKKIDEFKQIIVERKIGAPKKKKSKLTIQDHLLNKARNFAADEIDPVVDEIFSNSKYKNKVDPYAKMNEHELSQGHARYIVKMYDTDIEELQSLVDGTADKQLKEGYKTYTKTQIKSALDFYTKVKSGAEMLIKKSVATRKPRKTKAKTRDFVKDVASFKYKTECSDLGIVSVSPVKIIGAKQMWAYNTVTRKISKYVSLDTTGLDVKGTTVKNYSTTNSSMKTLRDPAKQIKNFTGGIRKFTNQYKDINGKELEVKSRLNDDTIILACFK